MSGVNVASEWMREQQTFYVRQRLQIYLKTFCEQLLLIRHRFPHLTPNKRTLFLNHNSKINHSFSFIRISGGWIQKYKFHTNQQLSNKCSLPPDKSIYLQNFISLNKITISLKESQPSGLHRHLVSCRFKFVQTIRS